MEQQQRQRPADACRAQQLRFFSFVVALHLQRRRLYIGNIVRSFGIGRRIFWQHFVLPELQHFLNVSRLARLACCCTRFLKLVCTTHARECYFYSSQALIALRLGMFACRSASADGTGHIQPALAGFRPTPMHLPSVFSVGFDTAVRREIEMYAHSCKYMQRTQPKNDGTMKLTCEKKRPPKTYFTTPLMKVL